MFINSCQKNELTNAIVEETQASEVFYKMNRLAFNTVQSYDNTIANLSEPGTIKNLEQTNESPLKTLKKSLNQDEELYDDFLLSILNEDKIVQIGEWIIKVDMENELVSVISEDNIDLMENLIEDVENENIYKFTTEDDVLDLLETGAKASPENSIPGLKKWCWGCCDSKAIAHKLTYFPAHPYLGELYVRIRYYKAGIYYSLYSIVEKSGTANTGEYIDVTIQMGYEFFDRCGRSYDRTPYKGPYTTTGRITGYGNKKYKVYESSRNLSKYYADAKFYLNMYQNWSLHSTWQNNNWMTISSNW